MVDQNQAEQVQEENNEFELNLSNLSPYFGSKKKRKRLGIGEGSGNGKTCGKGHKGAKSRSGFSLLAGFEGGQMPLYRRLPKVGFTSRKKVLGANIFTLVPLKKIADAKIADVTLESLAENGLISSAKDKVKITTGVDISEKINLNVHAVTKSARAAVEKAGGEISLIERKKKEKNKK